MQDEIFLSSVILFTAWNIDEMVEVPAAFMDHNLGNGSHVWTCRTTIKEARHPDTMELPYYLWTIHLWTAIPQRNKQPSYLIQFFF